MSLDLTSFDAALKQLYISDAVRDMVYQDNPFLALVPKKEDFRGKNMPLVSLYGNPQNRSATFSTAQAGTSTSKLTDFVLTRVQNYSIATIDNETMEASRGDAGAFLEAAKVEIDGAIHALSRDLATGLFRDESGYLAQVNAEPTEAASTVITLKSTAEVTNFEVGMIINIFSAKSGGSQRSIDGSTTDLTIDNIDRQAGTITFAGQAYDSSGTIAADDYLFVKGDRGGKISGVEAWVPDSAPTSTAFFGVDRSVDTSRLGGIRVTGTNLPIEEALVELASQCAREGGKIDHIFLNYEKYAELDKAMGARVHYVDVNVNQYVGFRGIMLNGPRGPIKVIPDQNMRPDRAYGLQMNTWLLASLGPAVKIIDSDGLTMLRQSSADGVEVRIGSYAQLGCRAPGWNGTLSL